MFVNCCTTCCTGCGDDNLDFTSLVTSNIADATTIELFEIFMESEFVDAKTRKVLSGYPALRAVYDRYMNSNKYCDTLSSKFDYNKMDQFVGLINNYWDDLIEQVIPATTLWGSIKVYTNTIFDQQKFKYKSYTSIFDKSKIEGIIPPSPINGSTGQCQSVEVIVSPLNIKQNGLTTRYANQIATYDNICLAQMNWGSEFFGTVTRMNDTSVK